MNPIMAGRRILDAAALFNASRAVTSKHVALRIQQLDVYSKTSSLATAVKGQTDRVTPTVQAASALARRFNGPAPSYSTSTHGPDTATKGGPVHRKDHAGRVQTGGGLKEGLEQDHFYERSDVNSTVDPVPNGELGVKQEESKRHPLPDGSIPPAGSDIAMSNIDEDTFSSRPQTEPVIKPFAEESEVIEKSLEPESSGRPSIPASSKTETQLSAKEAKILQRQAEAQIPARTAEPPLTRSAVPQSNASTDAETAELGVGQEQDVFYSPSTTATPVLSALPRVKVPKFTEDTQESDEHVPDQQINQDVFYSSSRRKQEKPAPQAQAVPEQAQLSEDMYADIFHSPRVAKLLGWQGRRKGSPDALELQGAKGTPVDRTNLSGEKDQETFNVRTSAEEAPKPREPSVSPENDKSAMEIQEEDVHELAADLAKDAQTSSSSGGQLNRRLKKS
ncbi:MAG: ABC1-domain-containing [Lasallia pustulata]|uniref:ABC1-domain-containing n=1 Tax=Lasallia pustulata TaxID=136370 RepID=A0A5M8PSJ4_9LECA|nr:MAG: ABC1-domain-containing [Lasallia pustulata]